MAPVFSIIIPLFNREGSIRACLASATSQTISNIEIIVIDDGSTDNSASIVKSLTDSRVAYHYQSNAGGAAARNKGIGLARGAYIAFLDSDDVFLQAHLEKALPFLSGESTCYFSKVRVNRGSGVFFDKPSRGPGADEDLSEYLFCAGGFIPTITLIVPSVLAKATLYTDSLKYGQDKDFALRLAKNGAFFVFHNIVTAIWNDLPSHGRVSGKIDPYDRLSWLDRSRDCLTDRAYYSDLGWSVAKAFSTGGMKLKAMQHYSSALIRRCYGPKLAIIIFMQIVLPPNLYRIMSDFMARLGLRP